MKNTAPVLFELSEQQGRQRVNSEQYRLIGVVQRSVLSAMGVTESTRGRRTGYTEEGTFARS